MLNSQCWHVGTSRSCAVDARYPGTADSTRCVAATGGSWPATDSSHERQVRAGLRDVLVTGRTPAPREAALVALLQAIDQVPKVLGDVGVPARELRRRAKEVASASFADEAVSKAVQAVSAATTAVIVSAAVAGSASGG
ncbi:MAG: GPP34 family phosphoprotein [Dermatophilaceae bacterium]